MSDEKIVAFSLQPLRKEVTRLRWNGRSAYTLPPAMWSLPRLNR